MLPWPEVISGRLAATAVAEGAAGAEKPEDGEVEGPASCEPSGLVKGPVFSRSSLIFSAVTDTNEHQDTQSTSIVH